MKWMGGVVEREWVREGLDRVEIREQRDVIRRKKGGG
jgi:hypothetical protein